MSGAGDNRYEPFLAQYIEIAFLRMAMEESRLEREIALLTSDLQRSWRRPGPGHGQAAANRGQSGGSGTSTPTREAGKLQQQQAGSMTAASGNVWGGAAGKVKGAGGAPAAVQEQQQQQQQQSQTQHQQHVAENEFNADEVREFLKKSMCPNPRDELHAHMRLLEQTPNNSPGYHETVGGTLLQSPPLP